MNYLKPEITVYVNWLVSAQFIKQQIGKIHHKTKEKHFLLPDINVPINHFIYLF